MARIVARNASFYVDDNTGASTAMSGRSNNISLSWTSESPEVTSFSETTRTRVPGGLLDYSLTADLFYDEAASNVDALFSGLLGGSGTRFKFGPSGSGAGVVQYSGCVVLTQYSFKFGVADSAQVSVAFSARSGSLTRTTF